MPHLRSNLFPTRHLYLDNLFPIPATSSTATSILYLLPQTQQPSFYTYYLLLSSLYSIPATSTSATFILYLPPQPQKTSFYTFRLLLSDVNSIPAVSFPPASSDLTNAAIRGASEFRTHLHFKAHTILVFFLVQNTQTGKCTTARPIFSQIFFHTF